MEIEISVHEKGTSIVIKEVSVDQIKTFKDIFGDPTEKDIPSSKTNNHYLSIGEINRKKFNYSVYDMPNYEKKKYTIMFQKNNKE